MSVGWPDLGGALLWIAGTLLIAGGVAGLVVWRARRRGDPHILLGVTAAVARMWLVLVAVGIVFTSFRWFTGDVWIPGLPVQVSLPDPFSCAGKTGPFHDPTLLCAQVPTVDATISGLGIGTRLLLALGDLLGFAGAAIPAILVIVICRQMVRGAPFARSVARWLFIAALAILVAGMGAELVSGIGRALAAAEVLPQPGDGIVTTEGTYRLSLPLWPIGAALGLAALGVVFRHGWRLQRDTEGLV